MNKSLELLDTPGILWPKFEDQRVGLHLAMIGSIRDDILNTEELALEVLGFLSSEYPGNLQRRYGIKESEDRVEMLRTVGSVRKCIKKGNEIDYVKAADIILDDFRNGSLGRFTLEEP